VDYSLTTDTTPSSLKDNLDVGIELTSVPSRSGAQFALEDFSDDEYGTPPRRLTDQVKDARIRRDQDREVLRKLQQCDERDSLRARVTAWLPLSPRRHSRRSKSPTQKELISVVNNAFPPRMELQVLVCDIMPDHASWQRIRLGDIEKCKTFSRSGRSSTYHFRLARETDKRYRAMDVSEPRDILK
jgi:hypothetical protein